jgi:hypothetical protein
MAPPHVDLKEYDDADPNQPANDYPGSAGSAASGDPNVIFTQRLPRTVAEVKQFGAAHTRFEDRHLSDSFAFKLWCVLIPKTMSESADAKTSASKFFIEK